MSEKIVKVSKKSLKIDYTFYGKSCSIIYIYIYSTEFQKIYTIVKHYYNIIQAKILNH